MVRELKPALAIGLLVVPLLAPLAAQNAGMSPQAPPDESVPSDLRPLVAPAQSEMRLVTQRYTADRLLLAGNYQGGGDGGRGGAGRGGGPGAGPSGSARPPVSVSPNRIARLKRFDLDWQTALGRVDATRLSPAASNELETLKASVKSNLAQLDADAAAVAELAPLVPFAPRIIALYESRVRMEDVDAQRAAGEVTAIAKEVAQVRARLEAGLNCATGSEGLRVSREQATQGADATDSLRASLANWFAFFNGYDPAFTWWMGMPYKQADGALHGYAAFLREKVAAADRPASPAPPAQPNAPAAAPKFAEVPDLAELLALPRDEMATIVQRFTGRPGGGRGGEPVTRSPRYYQDWLAALKTVDFDKLSRNAQVNYVFIRTTSDMQIARARTPPQTDIPRKTDNTGITGAARGRVGLLQDLADEMIPYTPEELIALGYKELAWLEGEMRKASAQMGFGDDWKKAVEKVKTMHPPPGGQPAAIRDMLFEAVDYLRAHDMINVPQVAAESFRMNMMSPERQLINPFFTGGAQITVSYPTDTMEYESRLQSMRGNNVPFSHATAFHEMIPGHNLAFYLAQRYAGYRANLGGTPFYGEGWALYWEIILFDKGFHDTPEEKVGALFWRMHRAARIIFSMNFHLGQWSPQECIDFLVERVGHERDNATAEVRRSFQQAAPLYQAAYLLGGLQIRSMRKEMVESGQMTEKQFHDEIMRQGSMPIAWLRLSMSKKPVKPDTVVSWRFYGDIAAK